MEESIFISNSPLDTARIAEKAAERLKGGETLLLSGELGAGKTTFTKALFAALGVKETVTSPTFTIMKNYKGNRFSLHHIDMYRMQTEEEVEELGLREEIEDGDITVIEWNKFSEFSGKVVTVDIAYLGENKREIKIEGIAL